MGEVNFIVDQMKRVYGGEAWYGSGLREILADVTAERARARPLTGAHTIWEITLHIAAWMGAVRGRIEGKPVDEPEEGDWPAVEGEDEKAWKATLAKLDRAHEQLVEAVSSLSDQALKDKTAGRDHSLRFTLHGIIQHNLYHTGQIALLKKA
ncbi:MAG: DinB family protein [Acidobacteriota bacterium]